MPRKVIIDCDMGIDDAVALCMTLFDSRLDVLAVTATEGCVSAEQANSNLQAIVTELDPARYPRLGMARSTEARSVTKGRRHTMRGPQRPTRGCPYRRARARLYSLGRAPRASLASA